MTANREPLDAARRECSELLRLVKPLRRPLEEFKGRPVLVELDAAIQTMQAVLLLSRPSEGLATGDEAVSLAAWRAASTADVLAGEGFDVDLPTFRGDAYVAALLLSAWALGHVGAAGVLRPGRRSDGHRSDRATDAGAVAADPGDTLGAVQIPGNLVEDVNAQLAQLPDFAAAIFAQRIDDYTWEEISVELGCTAGVAEEVYELACAALRERLETSVEGD